METSCPHCGRSYPNLPKEAEGRNSVCKKCGVRFRVSLRAEKGEWQSGDIILDLYEVKKELGVGGFGKVYLLYHRGWQMNLAVKTPSNSTLEAAGGALNFEREAETWVSLGLHPHTVSCYYVRRVDNIPRVFAEYVAGGDLNQWIQQQLLYRGGTDRALARIID
ncbi:MAG: protein kinase, partial [Gammaproteobacteria bacterium]|nr:protein kinase [Gammaproteobacteria bacterium]